MILQGIKLVAFDATNTLLKFKVPPWLYYALVARDHGYTGTGEMLKNRMLESYKAMWEKHPNFGKGTISWQEWWRQVVQYTFKDQLPPESNVNIIADRLINEFKTTKCWETEDGAEKILECIRKRGIRVCVISNFDPRLHDILQNVNLSRHIDFIVTSYEFGHSKPDSRIFREAMKSCRVAVKEEECLHVGDDVKKDYDGARAAGWHALIINKHIKSEIPPAQDHVFNSLISLAVAIEKNNLKL